MKKKGSITLFVCLFLVIFLGVIQALLSAVKIAGARVQATAGVEEGLYSVFAMYDRELFEQYHLFFWDGAYNTGQLNFGKAYQVIWELTEQSCSPRKTKLDLRGENLWNCYLQREEITGYTLATDQQGIFLKQQAVDYMRDTLGIQGIQLLLKQTEEEDSWSVAEDGSIYVKEGEDAQRNYETEVSKESDMVDAKEQKDFENPLDVIKAVRKMGILTLVLPLRAEVSGASVQRKQLVSVRDLETGIGVWEEGSEQWTDSLLFREYLMTHLNCYTQKQEDAGLVYELEYVIAGKTSDLENLKSVVTRLLAVREAANMVYLMNDSTKQAEVQQMALLIASAVGIPVVQEVVCAALMAAWSFGESILDVKILLNGGKVPMLKTADSWRLSLANLSQIVQILQKEEVDDTEGMTYEQYLRGLISLGEIKQQVMRTMDIIENTMQAIDGREKFRLDCCVNSMEVTMCVNCNGKEYEIQRDYGYQM